jgi:hypothetical protein
VRQGIIDLIVDGPFIVHLRDDQIGLFQDEGSFADFTGDNSRKCVQCQDEPESETQGSSKTHTRHHFELISIRPVQD